MGVTCHWIDAETLRRHSEAIACRRLKGSHTVQTILASTFEDIQKELKWKGQSQTMAVTFANLSVYFIRLFGGQNVDKDTTSSEDDIPMDFSEVASFFDQDEESEFMYNLPHHHRCACHTLNLTASKDVEAAESAKTFKAVSRAAFQKRSSRFQQAEQKFSCFRYN
ncbi:hypothetical protein HOLleu_39831 [Holothuria leucospilota]|uniref:Uncharacterized protein n=1 Tax=Holothuria leucospilota TaxID=206669 RepID=A0A9Q0YHI8_HOLLE|nr:hypothetical protein HOLleu_39831 [Holothuria leucospilota]